MHKTGPQVRRGKMNACRGSHAFVSAAEGHTCPFRFAHLPPGLVHFSIAIRVGAGAILTFNPEQIALAEAAGVRVPPLASAREDCEQSAPRFSTRSLKLRLLHKQPLRSC